MSTEDSARFGFPLDRQMNGCGLGPYCPSLMSPNKSHICKPLSKPKRHGSKILSFLRSWVRSGSSSSNNAKQPNLQQELPTVIHRVHLNSRPSLSSLSLHNGVMEIHEISSSPTTSPSSPSSLTTPALSVSTGNTSLDLKFSKSVSSSPENRRAHRRLRIAEPGSTENALTPIPEAEAEPALTLPTIVTVEKAAATKVFFETHYNSLLGLDQLSPRSLRRRQLEYTLHSDVSLSPERKNQRRRAWAAKESDHLREIRAMKNRQANFTSSQYEVVKVLGKGSFGVVRLVRDKAKPGSEMRKEIYAMKVIRKSDMLRNSQEGHLRAERDFLVSAEGSRWVVPLIASFQDSSNLYLVMDYMPGGDFLGLLIRDNILSEPVTKFYVAEMILCIEEAHALRWIHRDVKPDNFLISSSGHLKISDFGLAFDGHWSHDQDYYHNHRYSILNKLGIHVGGDSLDRKEAKAMTAMMLKSSGTRNGRHDRYEPKSGNLSESDGLLNWRNRRGNRALARSVVGTSQYMAPEVVRGESYDARCDWWSVAVILYECLYGHTPFLAEEGGRLKTKENIVNHEDTFAFPNKPIVSKRCQELIQSIIQEKDKRLCSKRYGNNTSSVSARSQDYYGRFVYSHDAEDIKSHKWFKEIPWDRLHTMIPPFIPNIKSMEDTHYFEEEDPISDFSDSITPLEATPEDITEALKGFNREIKIIAADYIKKPHDTVKMRKIDKEIDGFNVSEEQKHYLRSFVRTYGKREKKRPRDRLLRDKEVAHKILELRKENAFLGYTYRRIRPARSFNGSLSLRHRDVWHRAQLSIH